MIDRYQFDEQRIGFYYNEDESCRKERGLDKDKSYIVWYNGEYSEPYIVEITDQPIGKHHLQYQTSIRAVNGTPYWGSRAKSAIFDFYQNGLVYMMPEMIAPEDMEEDWRYMLAVGVLELIQENDDTSFVPIIAPFKQEPEDLMLVPQLSKMLGVEKDKLPNFYVLHPYGSLAMPYPEALDKPENFSPEMILLWARRTVLYLEIELFEHDIKDYEEKSSKGEEIPEWETEKITRAKGSLKAAQEEQAIVMVKLEEMTEKVMANVNEFAEKLDEHKDVSHDHISRVSKDETAVNEEL